MAQKDCLEYLQNSGKATAYEVAEYYDIDPGSVMSNMDSLSNKGYVEVNKSERPTKYKITEKGKEANPDDLQGLVL